MLAFIVFTIAALVVSRFWWLGHWIGRTIVTVGLGGGLAFFAMLIGNGAPYTILIMLIMLGIGYVVGNSRFWYLRSRANRTVSPSSPTRVYPTP